MKFLFQESRPGQRPHVINPFLPKALDKQPGLSAQTAKQFKWYIDSGTQSHYNEYF